MIFPRPESGIGITFLIGTRAEFIKISQVISELNERGFLPSIQWLGLHSHKTLENSTLNFSHDVRSVKADSDIDTSVKAALWLLKSLFKVAMWGLMDRARNRKQFVVVHGDTFCTVLGAIYAKTSGNTLAHVEAGMRTFKLFQPFPEEINRRLVSLATNVHYAPGSEAVRVCSGYRGVTVDTVTNTALDAVTKSVPPRVDISNQIIVTLHRAELLGDKKVFTETIHELMQLAKSENVTWYVGDHEMDAIRSIVSEKELRGNGLNLLPRARHEDFLKKVIPSKCIITDSGGLQFECNYLRIPVVIHRKKSEYVAPIDVYSKMTFWVPGEITKLVGGIPKESSVREFTLSSNSPSKIIAADLLKRTKGQNV